jgi:hypothetical protein
MRKEKWHGRFALASGAVLLQKRQLESGVAAGESSFCQPGLLRLSISMGWGQSRGQNRAVLGQPRPMLCGIPAITQRYCQCIFKVLAPFGRRDYAGLKTKE